MAVTADADGAVLATFFPTDSRFEVLDEPRTLPESWRAERFDRADRHATDATYYAVLAVRGEYDGIHEAQHTLRVLYVADDLSATSYRDYRIEERDGYRPRAEEFRCTLALSVGFGAVDPIAGEEREVLRNLLDEQYPRARGDA